MAYGLEVKNNNQIMQISSEQAGRLGLSIYKSGYSRGILKSDVGATDLLFLKYNPNDATNNRNINFDRLVVDPFFSNNYLVFRSPYKTQGTDGVDDPRVYVNYAIARIHNNVAFTGSYGLQIKASNGTTVFDSRAFTTNSMMTIEEVKPSGYYSVGLDNSLQSNFVTTDPNKYICMNFSFGGWSATAGHWPNSEGIEVYPTNRSSINGKVGITYFGSTVTSAGSFGQIPIPTPNNSDIVAATIT